MTLHYLTYLVQSYETYWAVIVLCIIRLLYRAIGRSAASNKLLSTIQPDETVDIPYTVAISVKIILSFSYSV